MTPPKDVDDAQALDMLRDRAVGASTDKDSHT
ncbi:hypothetical protein XaFJ1_GM000745 [Xanthomonas albilineans]|nr:hypothetical protein XaFJ1_GM000745 [Xanthomonas albilineans]